MKKLLLVDDEEPIRRLMKTILEMNGEFSVDTASSAGEAIQRLDKNGYDAVVTDMRMETPLAGYDVVRAASKLEARPVTVILTAFPVPASEWKRVGADALLMKGSETLKLSEQIEKLLAVMHPPPRVNGCPLRAKC